MRLQWYIFGAVLRGFLATLLLVTATVFLVGTVQSFSRYSEMSLTLLLSRLPYLVPFAFTLAVPLALLIGTLLAYGRLSADNEILALRMGGIHPFRAVTPVLALGLALSLVMLFVNGTVSPLANARARAITLDDLRNFLDSLAERPIRQFHSDRIDMSWRSVSPDGSLLDVDLKLRGITLDPGGIRTIDAQAARVRIDRDPDLEFLRFTFDDLRSKEGERVVEGRRCVATVRVDSLFDTGGGRERRNTLTSRELLIRSERDTRLGAREEDEDVLGYRTEYAARNGLALACLVFSLIGAPLGMRFRQGSFVGAGLMAIVLAFVVYYPLHEIGWRLSIEGRVPAGIAMAIPGVVVGSIGAFLLLRVMRR